jgi:hypothetical protein
MGMTAIVSGLSRDRACIRWSPPGFAWAVVKAEVIFVLSGCFFSVEQKGERREETGSKVGGALMPSQDAVDVG